MQDTYLFPKFQPYRGKKNFCEYPNKLHNIYVKQNS